jgi:hypothetical protein
MDDLTARLSEVHAHAEQWQTAKQDWVERSEARVRHWRWAPAGSELHWLEPLWHERHGDKPARLLDVEPTGPQADRYGYDERGRILIAFRRPLPGNERAVECFDYETDGVIWAVRYSEDGRMQVVRRAQVEHDVVVEVLAYQVLIPLGDRIRMRCEAYTWDAGRLLRIDREAGDWTDAGWVAGPQQSYVLEYDAAGELAGTYHEGGARLWARPILPDAEFRALERRIADAIAAEVERRIAEARPPAEVFCVGMFYSPGLPDEDMLWPHVALGLDLDRQQPADPPARLWHPLAMSVQLGQAVPGGPADLTADAILLARELRARGDGIVAEFFAGVAGRVADSHVVDELPATDDRVVFIIDDSEGPTREEILRNASTRARNLLLRSGSLP